MFGELLRVPALVPLRDRDFRFLAVATSLSAFGAVGETVVFGWLVLDLTDSPLMVGVVLGVRQLPNAFFGIPAGAVADSVDRRRLIRRLTLSLALPAAILGMLVLTERVQIWQIAALAFAGGTLRAFEATANTSYAYDLVGPARAVQGLAMRTMASGLGGLTGSMTLGVIVARVGAHASFFAMAGTYVMSALVMLMPKSRGHATTRQGSAKDAVAEFFSEIRRNRTLLALVVGTGLVEVLGFSHIALLPSIARDILHVGADGLGVMSGVGRLGGFVGIAVLSTLAPARNRGLVYIGAFLVFGVLIVLLGRVPTFALALILLAVISSMMAVSDVLSQSLMQLSVPNELRGRAIGSWTLAVGSGPLGTIQIGALASVAGVAVALAANGAALVAVAVAMLALVPSIRRV